MLYVFEGGSLCGGLLSKDGFYGCEAGGGISGNPGDGHGKAFGVTCLLGDIKVEQTICIQQKTGSVPQHADKESYEVF